LLELAPEVMRRRYILRCLNLDGFQLAYYCFLGFLAAEPDREFVFPPWTRLLLRAGLEFGICLQILNDLEDFLTPETDAAFRDLLSGRLTYFGYALARKSEICKQIIVKVAEQGRENVGLADVRLLRKAVDQERSMLREVALELLARRSDRMIRSLRGLKGVLKDGGRLLDFLFPHIFCSRILRTMGYPAWGRPSRRRSWG
jgi:geranylgeranyl pyrophosphate synthase